MVGNSRTATPPLAVADLGDLRVGPLTARAASWSAKFLSDPNGVARTLLARSCRDARQTTEGEEASETM
jgi:hypothetical protein